MPHIVMARNIDADAETVFRAISTTDGVTGWFTSEAEIGEGVVGHHLLTFPEIVTPWDLHVTEFEAPRRLTLAVLVGPAQWDATTMTYELVDRPGGGFTTGIAASAVGVATLRQTCNAEKAVMVCPACRTAAQMS